MFRIFFIFFLYLFETISELILFMIKILFLVCSQAKYVPRFRIAPTIKRSNAQFLACGGAYLCSKLAEYAR